ncbi:DUF6297 family protein [Williamsia sp. Leaf354]|jgi:hypothetical protein|uniref:DUF6297 family protein n=1 Tax=Williamsia sp. Leaf354 TaxID=1736349 RepID=UPI000A5B6F76|nr:DUF6297 family protein [Williamsia sp. Leaf354]
MSVTRDDAPGIVLTGAVVAGFGWYLLQPERVASVIGVAHGIAHPTVVLVGWAIALCALVVGTAVWWWGPIRLSRAEAMWHLTGPGDRGPVLASRRRSAVVAALLGCLVTAAIVAVLDWSSTPAVLGAGVVAAVMIVAAGTWHQHRSSDRLSGRPRRGRQRWAPALLHRDAFAPDDGFIAAARLAAVTLDFSWIDTARVVRWQLGHAWTRSRRLGGGRIRAMILADVLRLSRRRGDLALSVVVLAVTVALPSTLYLTSIAPVVATVLAYRAGCAWACGLRRLTEVPALRRALGGSDPEVTAIHAVVPVSGVVLCCAVMALTWQLSLPAVLVVAVGSAFATVRRATRPDLPFDAPVYVTGQGGATQPLLLLAMVRGLVAVVVTSLLAVLIG